MKSQSLMTDHAMALAAAILEIVSPALREEDKREAFNLFVEAAKAMLLSFEEKSERMTRRVKPSAN